MRQPVHQGGRQGGIPEQLRPTAEDIMEEPARGSQCVGYTRRSRLEPQTNEAGTMDSTTFVGWDVHKDSIAAAVARPGRQEGEQLRVARVSGADDEEAGQAQVTVKQKNRPSCLGKWNRPRRVREANGVPDVWRSSPRVWG